MKVAYNDEKTTLYLGDCFKILKNIPENSIDMIFSDPPYFLSNNGISVSGGKQVSVNKGNWDKGKNDINSKHNFNRKWIRQCYKILKDTGTIWISGTYHNIYSIGMALEQEGFKIINNVTWQKLNPPPNLTCRCFTHSTETIIWAKKNCKGNKHFYNYSLMKELNNGKQMKDVWCGSLTSKKEKTEGKHPTQKPEYLLNRIILASTKENDVILDPFNGSGTTGVVARRLNRKYVGIEQEKEFMKLTIRRLKKIINDMEESSNEK